jgi:acyl carrier protein
MSKRTAEVIEEWLVSYLSRLLGIDPEKIGTSVSFARYGLDSSASIAMTSDLSDWLGREIDPTINYSYPTIAALAKHLAE